ALDPACISKATSKFTTALGKAGTCADGGSPLSLVENKCVTPAMTTDGGGMVNNVCPSCGTLLAAFGWGVTDGANQFEMCTSNCRAGIIGSGDGQFFDNTGVAVDGSGNVFVVDTNNNRIEKFTNTGTFLLTFGWGVADGANQFEMCTSNC